MTITADILSLIPQRPPFVMVDLLLSSNDIQTRSAFKIMRDNIFVEGLNFREPGLVENIAQTAAAHAGYLAVSKNSDVRLGYIGAIKNLEIFDLPKINDEIITEITIENQIFDVSVISGKIWCHSKVVAQCEMKIFISNK